MTVTFGGTTLSNASTYEDDAGVICNVTRLLSGKVKVQASSETSFNPTFRCLTESSSEVSTVKGKIGTSSTLIIDSTSYTNCYIKSFKSKQYAPGKYSYEVSFVRDTA